MAESDKYKKTPGVLDSDWLASKNEKAGLSVWLLSLR